MSTNSDRDIAALTKRAITASVVALVFFGSMAASPYLSPERTEAVVEQAQRTASRMNARESAVLEREAERAAAAFAEEQAAEQQARAEAQEQARIEAQRLYPPSHG